MDEIKVGVIVAQIINFLVIFFIFKYFLGEKIVNIIEERRKSIKDTKKASDIAKETIKKAEDKVNGIIDDAKKKAMEIEEEAIRLSKQNADKIIEVSEKEALNMLEMSKQQIEKDRLYMENNMKSKILDLALKINSEIFKNEKVNKDFIEKEYELLIK